MPSLVASWPLPLLASTLRRQGLTSVPNWAHVVGLGHGPRQRQCCRPAVPSNCPVTEMSHDIS